MAKITIVEAARQGFKSRSQINKDVRAGKLPSVEERGRKVVDVADLVRLYGEPGAAPVDTSPAAAINDKRSKVWFSRMPLESDLLEARSKLEDERNAAAKERDRLMELVESGNKLLADMRADKERDAKVMQELTEALNRPLWKRIFGGK
jgi:hypothetical protein